MPVSTHIAALERRHRDLDARIAGAEARPAPDDKELAKLKRDKLRLKDEIERLRGEPTRH